MNIDTKTLPDDPELLKSLLTDLSSKFDEEKNQHQSLKDKYAGLEEEYKGIENQWQEKYNYLQEKYQILRKMFFGKKSEKLTPEDQNQMLLFNEAEDGADDSGFNIDNESESEKSTTEVKGYTRKKTGRKPLPADIPREEVIHDLSEEEKKCSCCGSARPLIGKEESEELEIIPAEIKVLKHVRLKYGPCECEEFLNREIPEVKTASMPARMIPRSIAAPGLLAYVLTSKFEDALPFYRQSKIFKRIDADISRATMCNWTIAVADRCRPLIEIMTEKIRSGPLIQMDETTVQVLREPGRPPESKSYMWVAVGYPNDEKRLVLYQYHPTRSQTVPDDFLKSYKGYLQTDGYAGYNEAVKNSDIIHAGCFAHARRYFFNALKLNKKSKAANNAIKYIQKIYEIERRLREQKLPPEIFLEKRKKEVMPVLDKFHYYLITQKEIVVSKSKTGEAINYTLNEWGKLIRYLNFHLLTPDNNAVENAIRPFVVGRKNWLFSNTPKGAESSAIIYSLIESAKANRLDPYKYLRFLFIHLPSAGTQEELKNLLPDQVTQEQLSAE